MPTCNITFFTFNSLITHFLGVPSAGFTQPFSLAAFLSSSLVFLAARIVRKILYFLKVKEYNHVQHLIFVYFIVNNVKPFADFLVSKKFM